MNRLSYRIGPILLLVLIAATVPGCTKKARVSRMLQAANRDFNEEKYDAAEIEYRDARRVDPMNPTAIAQLGRLYLKEGRLMEAYPYLKEGTKLEPNSLPVQLAFAQVSAAFHDVTNACQISLRILSAQPTNEDALVLLVDTLGSPRQLVQTLDSLPHVQENPAYHVALGMVALREKKLAEAGKELQLALVANPQSSQAYFALADLDMLQRDPTNAALALQKAANFAPLRSAVRSKYIEYLIQSGSVDEGKKLAVEMTEKAPDYLPGWIELMNLSLNQRKYDDAVKYADNILQRDDKNYEALIGLGSVSLAKGDGAQAVIQLEHTDSLYKRSPQVKYDLGAAYLLSHDKVKGVEYLNQALAIDPTFRSATLLLAQIDTRGGDASSAVALLTRYLKKVPSDGQAALLLAEAYLAQQKPESAIAVYRKMAEALPKNPQIQMLMGLVFVAQHRNSEARAAFEKSLALAPDYLASAEQLIDLDISEHKYKDAMALTQAQITKNPKAAEPWEIQAKVYVAQTNMDQAESSLLKAIDLNPDLPNPYLLLAQVYVSSGKEQEALKKLNNLVGRTNAAPAYLQIGAIHEKLKEFDAARDAYEKVLTINPKSSPALNNLAYIYAVRLNNVDKAYALAQRARELLPYNANVADTLGWVLYKKGDYTRALTLLEEGAELSPGDAEIQFHLGMTHYMMDEEGLARVALQRAAVSTQDFPNKDEATNRLAVLNMDTSKANASVLAGLEKVLQDRPDDPVILNRLGTLQERQGEPEKAAGTYESALKRNPDAVPIMSKLARLYAFKLNEPEKAMNLATAAHKLAPDNPNVSAVLGHLVFRSGDYVRALSLLENAADQLSGQPEFLYDLAWAYYGIGRVADAQTTMEKALQISAGFAGAADAKQFVELVDAFQNTAKTQGDAGLAQKVLQADPNYVPALMISGAADERARNFKAAHDAYNKALSVFPMFVPAARQTAILDANYFHDDPQGYSLAEKARAAYPDDPAVARSLGILCYYQAKYPRSAEVLQESIDQDRKDGEAYYYLGMDFFQSKRNGESKQALEKALALKIPDPLASTARQTLQAMK